MRRDPRPDDDLRGYGRYLAFHVVAALPLALKGYLRAKKRSYTKGVWKRAFGGDRAPHRARWVVIFAGGLGETRVATQIAEVLRRERGAEVAILSKADDAFAFDTGATFHGRSPFNSPVAVALFLRRWTPRAIVTIEFNDNHHLKALARRAGVRQVVINVPITEEETERVIAKREEAWRWTAVDLYLTQTEAQAERVRRLGVSADQVVAAGALGANIGRGPVETEARIRTVLHLEEGDGPVVVAGSTYPQDEPIILAAFARLRERRPGAVLVLAPRKLARPEGVDSSLKGLRFARWSEPFDRLPEDRVVLLDVYGELRNVYAVADVAIVGGTWGIDIGGHTPMESIAWGVPVLVGPLHSQQIALVERLVEKGAGIVFEDPEELARRLVEVATDDGMRRRMRAAAEEEAKVGDEGILALADRLGLLPAGA